ncbi:hypothetical protein DFH29DRAFT_795853, partial [Suillus ampliporus]
LITGVDSGIGRAAAIIFAREDLKGITFSHLPQEQDDAKVTAEAIAKEGCDDNVVAVDLRHETDCQKLVQSDMKNAEYLGEQRLEVNVNILFVNIPLSRRRFKTSILLNVRSNFESTILQMIGITKFAVPHMRRGSAINTASVVAYGAPKLQVRFPNSLFTSSSAHTRKQRTFLLRKALS